MTSYRFTIEEFNMFIYCVLPTLMTDGQLRNYIKGALPTFSTEKQDHIFHVIRACAISSIIDEKHLNVDLDETIHYYSCVLQIIKHIIHLKPLVVLFLMPTYREDLINCFFDEARARVKMITSHFRHVIENLYKSPIDGEFSCVFENMLLVFTDKPRGNHRFPQ